MRRGWAVGLIKPWQKAKFYVVMCYEVNFFRMTIASFLTPAPMVGMNLYLPYLKSLSTVCLDLRMFSAADFLTSSVDRSFSSLMASVSVSDGSNSGKRARNI